MKKRNFFGNFDKTLFITTLILSIIGIIIIASATSALPEGSFGYIKTQLASTILGIIAIFIILKFDFSIFEKLYIPIYILSNLLLLLTLFFGIGLDEWGSNSWLRLGGFSFQPSELVKITFIISLAKFISLNKFKLNEPLVLLKILAFIALPVFLILKQPDLGTAIVFVVFSLIMLFVANIDLKYIIGGLVTMVVSLPLLWFAYFDLYQKNRILNFIDPTRDPLGSSYQVLQSKLAIGSGKIFGMGFLGGNQTQYGYLPEKHTDFIYAVLGEELGLVGGVIIIALFFLLLYRLILISRNCKDSFKSLVVIGIAGMFFFHIFENIGMTLGLMPVTGIPLPFISYGGTFQLITLIAIGIALNISVRSDDLNF